MHFVVGRSNFDNFFQLKKAVRPQRKSWLEEGDCICVNEDFFSWPFISALSALFSSPFFFLSFLLSCFEALFLCVGAQNLSILGMVYLRAPDHDVASLCQWRSSERTYCSAQNNTRFAFTSTQRLAPTGMSGSMPFEHCKSPLIVFESPKVSEVFDVRGKQERRREAGPVRLSKKCYLQKTNASPSRTWQNPTTQCLQNPSFAIDKLTAALSLRKIPRSSMPSCFPLQSCPESEAQRRAARPREHATLQRATLSRPEVPRGILHHLHVIWHAYRRGFRDRLSLTQSLSCPTRTERLKRCALRQLEDLPVACFSKKKEGNESVPTLWAVLERHDDLQLAKTKTNKIFQPAKSDQIFVWAGKVKRQSAKCRQCRLCGELWS